jgi:uncharacterized protein
MFFQSGFLRAEEILKEAERGRTKLYMHVLNLGEVYYNVFKGAGENLGNSVSIKVKNYPVELVDDLSENFLLSAARIKGIYPIFYADAFAATSIEKEAILITGDPDLKLLERDGKIKVLWIRNV